MECKNALSAGTVLHGISQTYRIEKVLGQGSFGITYLAMTQVKVSGALGELDTTLQVAIKEFFMKDVNGRQGSTAQNLSRFRHPHIVRVL